MIRNERKKLHNIFCCFVDIDKHKTNKWIELHIWYDVLYIWMYGISILDLNSNKNKTQRNSMKNNERKEWCVKTINNENGNWQNLKKLFITYSRILCLACISIFALTHWPFCANFYCILCFLFHVFCCVWIRCCGHRLQWMLFFILMFDLSVLYVHLIFG